MAWTADEIEQLRRYWGNGRTCRDIAILIGKTKNAVIGAARRNGLDRRPSPIGEHHAFYKEARKRSKNTPPSDARPARSDSGGSAPLENQQEMDRVHAGGGVATKGKSVNAGKAKGGRMSADNGRSYFATFGGKRGDHDRARLAAQRSRANDTDCAACHSAPAVTHGLCQSCNGIVTRSDPAAAYGGEPGNLSRASSGLEADNIITAEPEAA